MLIRWAIKFDNLKLNTKLSLTFCQRVEMVLELHQFVECSLFDYFAVLEHQNAVRILDCAQSVRNRNRRLFLKHRFQVLEHYLFGVSIQRARKLIEEEQSRFLYETATQSDALLLTARHLSALLSDFLLKT